MLYVLGNNLSGSFRDYFNALLGALVANDMKSSCGAAIAAYIFHGLCDLLALEDVFTRKTKNGFAIDQLVVTDSALGIIGHVTALRNKYPNIDDRIRVLPTVPLFASALLKPTP